MSKEITKLREIHLKKSLPYFQSLSGHTTPVDCVRFGQTEELVCAGSQSGALKIWDLEAARLVRSLTGHKSGLTTIDFHPYGDFLSSGSSDTNLKLWDIRRKGCIFTYKGHSQCVNSVKFSPDGQWIASGGEDGAVKVRYDEEREILVSFFRRRSLSFSQLPSTQDTNLGSSPTCKELDSSEYQWKQGNLCNVCVILCSLFASLFWSVK